MIKSLSGKTENINAALKSSDAEIRAKLKKIKEVEIELYDYVLNISETLEKLNPFILKKADELRNQNSGLRESFHSKGITSYDNVLKTVDDILDGTTSITDIDIGAITACLTQDNFKNEGSTLCDTANMPEEGCAVDDSGMPSCDACVFGVTDYSGRDNCASGTYSNCGGCYGGRNATRTDRCNSDNSCGTVGSGSCTGYVFITGGESLTCSSGVSCTARVTCAAGVMCDSGNSTKTCNTGYVCNSGNSCTSSDSGGTCSTVSCNEVACTNVGVGCTSVSCTGSITSIDDGTCNVVSSTSGTMTCVNTNSGTCSTGNTCENVSQVCTNCNVCEGCNNCNAGCNSCETCDGCNQCNTYAGTCGQGGAICSSGKGCQGNFGERCGSFFQ